MLRFFSIGFSQFLLFAGMVLMIFTNVGQLTSNIVSRNISIAKVRISSPNDILKSITGDSGLGDLLPGAKNGAPSEIKWGLYNHCAYWNSNKPSCSDRGFGQALDPVETFTTDLGMDNSEVNKIWEHNNRVSNLHEKSTAAFYLVFIGTILIGVAFLITCLIHMSALVIAGIFAFLAFALLLCGAAIYTYIIHEFKKASSPAFLFDYGDSLWFTWASVGCALFAIPALLSGSFVSRRRYYDEPY